MCYVRHHPNGGVKADIPALRFVPEKETFRIARIRHTPDRISTGTDDDLFARMRYSSHAAFLCLVESDISNACLD
jgi:hypothetical protein